MNEETRSWKAIQAENIYLHEQLDQARKTIAEMRANEKLGTYMVYEGDVWKLQPARLLRVQDKVQ